MLHDIGYAVFGLGLAFVSYSIGRIINNVSLLLEDSHGDSFDNSPLSYIFTILSVAFYFLGLPAAAIVYITHSYPNRRLEKSIRKEERDSMKEFHEREVRYAVNAEHDRLVAYYEDLMSKRSDTPR